MTDVPSGSPSGSGRTILPRTVRLCSLVEPDEGLLRRSGAVFSDGAWTVCLDEDCDIAALVPWLPRSAGGVFAGEPCGHVPRGHAADLSRSLCPSSWRVLAEVTCLRTGACVECGEEVGRSAAPSWSWDERHEGVSGHLLRLRALCTSCHHCSRPDATSWRWPTTKRHARIAAIMRMDATAVATAVAEHSNRFASWEGKPMSLDMSVLSGLGLAFRKGWTHEEDVLISQSGSVRISGVSLSSSRGMVRMA